MPKAKRKTTPRTKQKIVPNQPWWKHFLSFIASPVIRRLILIVVIVAALCLWGDVAWESTLALFGYGLVIIAIALGVLIWVIWRGHFRASIKKWNWFLGGISLALATWGVLSIFNFGGNFGQSIIGTSTIAGDLRIAGLILLGIIFIIPGKFWHAIVSTVNFCGWVLKSSWHLLAKAFQPHPKAIPPQLTSAQATPSEAKMVAEMKAEPVTITPSPAIAMSQSLERSEGKVWQFKHQPTLTPGGWQLPPIDILDKPVETKLDKDDIDKRAQLIEESLASYGVEAKVVQINMGPTVTQFGVEPGWDRKYKEIKERSKDGEVRTRTEETSRTRIRVDRITSLANDLALALAAPSIRIEAPVPGKSMIGIEVPNTVFGSVSLRSVIESAAFQKIKARSKIAIALGKGAGGEAVSADLSRMPHLLIAGATGSGKTVCLDSIICCLLLHNSPDDVRFIMVDPKRVELVAFNGIPHLFAPVVVDSNKAIKALRWLNQEMDNRYRQFAQAGVRNIEGYNKDRPPGDSLPYLVLVIDELADLMMTAFDEVEHTLCRLAQLARATGIHLLVATQRPSVDVVTGLIKANFPTRVSFAVTSQVDSRTILDTVGAEKLLGRGDMLYMPSEASKPKRLQGTFISDAEMERLVYFWGNQRRPEIGFVDFDELAESITPGQKIAALPDPLLEEARRLAQEYKHVSTSFLQRHLRVGYPRAARLMESLEQKGLVETDRPKQEN
jgi:DNA segregation ATPase FtsK/SpoIIIE and related proteins